jgi:hypothetical protein
MEKAKDSFPWWHPSTTELIKVPKKLPGIRNEQIHEIFRPFPLFAPLRLFAGKFAGGPAGCWDRVGTFLIHTVSNSTAQTGDRYRPTGSKLACVTALSAQAGFPAAGRLRVV